MKKYLNDLTTKVRGTFSNNEWETTTRAIQLFKRNSSPEEKDAYTPSFKAEMKLANEYLDGKYKMIIPSHQITDLIHKLVKELQLPMVDVRFNWWLPYSAHEVPQIWEWIINPKIRNRIKATIHMGTSQPEYDILHEVAHHYQICNMDKHELMKACVDNNAKKAHNHTFINALLPVYKAYSKIRPWK